ncbi:MAG: LD-carboxypeptidase [Fimbriimonadaceae bacterium]|nr:LD-carboxypeptidase [Fimbriimonadaceae bacterium]
MISRREVLGGLAAVGLTGALSGQSAPADSRIRLPKALTPGDKVAIVAPAGKASGQAHVTLAAAKVRSLGFEPAPSRNILARHGYFAGTDEQRASDMNDAIRDPSIRGIIALRGGYGAMRILDQLDYEALRRDPKVLIGFSDITAIHLAFVAEGVAAFHGPCAESSWSEYSRATLPVVTRNQPYGGCARVSGGDPLVELVPGRAEGVLTGGNLSMVTAMVGTRYSANLEGSVVVLEDIGEDSYRVDRMLTQLLLAGLNKAAAVVFGNFRPRARPGSELVDPSEFTIGQVWRDRAKAIGVPCFAGLPFGHVTANHILPLGIRARVDATACTLSILDPAVG